MENQSRFYIKIITINIGINSILSTFYNTLPDWLESQVNYKVVLKMKLILNKELPR